MTICSKLDNLIDINTLENEEIIFFNEIIIGNINSNSTSKIELGCVYTMFGEKIEDFLSYLLNPKIRAGDKYNIALKCQELYKILFNKVNPENFIFNKTFYIENHVPLPSFIENIKKIKTKKDFEEILKTKAKNFFHIEVDLILEFLINPQIPLSDKIMLFESKMFSVPLAPSIKEKLSILREHLTKTKLKKYLITRNLDYYILMTFCYLHNTDNETRPLMRDSSELEPYNLPSTWAVHFAFINKNALKFVREYKGSDEIQALANNIMKAIESNQNKLLSKLRKDFQLPKNINFRITYNVIKVVLMFQYMVEKDKQIEELSKKLEEAQKKIAEEQELRKKEQELRKKEQEELIKRIKKLEEEIRKLKQNDN
ncbi:MAG: hypothetical protein ACTSO9_07630 [Candidatus Helarchaeota archaeon]